MESRQETAVAALGGERAGVGRALCSPMSRVSRRELNRRAAAHVAAV